ncbi:MAG: hypothetical protein JKY08_08605 [Flavobacteriaceae bacterium]|nr:hypothetical protein [Flavobacteriaceae bacterium]
MKTLKLKALIILLITFIACNSSSEIQKEVLQVLSKQELLENVYTSKVVPLFNSFKALDIPTEFVVDTKDLSINAGASFGYVEVSQGLINSDKEAIQVFVLAHEVAHIATISQAIKFELGEEIPAGAVINPYQKAEFLADLMAVHLLLIHEPAMKIKLEVQLSFLKSLLGTGSFTHPSGNKRIAFIQEYFKLAIITSPDEAFYYLFSQTWSA